jgi:hypothetical protein
MFKTVVVGPIATRPFALARTCIECDAGPQGDRPCRGFGPGCLGARRRDDETLAEDRSVRFLLWRDIL